MTKNELNRSQAIAVCNRETGTGKEVVARD
jgi:hypothetical protein